MSEFNAAALSARVYGDIDQSGTANEILDRGASGLEYFKQFLTHYRTVNSKFGYGNAAVAGRSENYFYAKYDTERDLDFHALDQIKSELAKIVAAVPAEIECQRTQRAALPLVWQGQAGDSALSMLNAQVMRAENDVDQAKLISQKFTDGVAALRTAVVTKAQMVREYWNITDIRVPTGTKVPYAAGPQIPNFTDGIAAGQMDMIIVIASSGDSGSGTQVGGESDLTTAEGAKKWLRDTFVKHFDFRVDQFETLCTQTEGLIRQVYGDLTSALNALDNSAYPVPAENAGAPKQTGTGTGTGTGSSSSAGAGSGSGTGSGSGAGSGSGTGSGSGSGTGSGSGSGSGSSNKTTTTTTSTSGLSSLTDVISELSSLISDNSDTITSAASTLGTSLSSLGTTLSEGIQNVAEQLSGLLDTDGDGKSEFTLGDQQISVETGADGELKVTTTDSTGKEHEYALTLDAQGNPSITEKGTDDTAAGQEQAEKVTETGSGTPGLGDTDPNTGAPLNATESGSGPTGLQDAPGTGQTIPTVPPVKKSEDTEQDPKPAAPASVPDTGAELAEAGPL